MVVVRHAFPNALLPLITIVGLQVGMLMAGAFITEQIFTWPGMGRLALDAILSHDYPVIQAFAVIIGVRGPARQRAGRPGVWRRRPADPAGVAAMTAVAVVSPWTRSAPPKRERGTTGAAPIPAPPGRAGSAC